ncbi:alpha-xylosidase, partial [Micromonospora humida]
VAATGTVGDGPFDDVTLVSWGGVDARTVLHDVDGDTVVQALRDGDTLRVRTDGPLRVRRLSVVGDDAPRRLLLNGEPVTPTPFTPWFPPD